ncbi:redoxin domain-containing protein [Undibacterium sp. Di26W]|uniref:redoxin domain-containing protein n=1 Tax=Undibacterium sp. Di26W TaxID=3413035 RepID=UPI003BF4154C
MLRFILSLFHTRLYHLYRWFASGALIALGIAVAMVTNMSAADEARDKAMKSNGSAHTSDLPVLGHLPPLVGASAWLNSTPIDSAQLSGKVVLIDFWTYSCINCIRTLPHVRAWAEKYRAQGLVVIGVHTPEFDFEKDTSNIKKAIARFKIDYPIAVDSEHHIWNAFRNNAWPVFYFADAQGRIRARLAGEGNYDKAETIIQSLLAEAGQSGAGAALTTPKASAEQAAPDIAHLRSGETYVGYQQASNFSSNSGLKRDTAHDYLMIAPRLNEWSLAGNWTVGAERANLNRADGSIVYRFNARDLHLVLGPRADGMPVRFQVRIDGHAPGADHGSDTDAEGNGTVTEARLYQLVRQSGKVKECSFEIRFLDAGVGAFAFTFG